MAKRKDTQDLSGRETITVVATRQTIYLGNQRRRILRVPYDGPGKAPPTTIPLDSPRVRDTVAWHLDHGLLQEAADKPPEKKNTSPEKEAPAPRVVEAEEDVGSPPKKDKKG